MAEYNGNRVTILSSEEMSGAAKSVTEKLRNIHDHYSHIAAEYKTFPNGEVSVRIPETVRSQEVYFFHSLFHPDPNTGIMKMLLTNNAVSLASAKSLVLVLLYMPYLRQDRKDRPRVPISARVLADLIETNKSVKRIITMDMHVEQEEGFFSIPVDNLRGAVLHAEYFREVLNNDFSNVMVVAPDFGAAVRARRFAKLLGEDVPVGILEKERVGKGGVITHNLIGEDPTGKDLILYDDMIDTGGTILTGAKALYERGANRVCICATHGIFSPTAESTAEEKFIEAQVPVVVTGSIPRSTDYLMKHASWLTVLPVEDLLAKVLHESDRHGGSVSSLL